MAIANESESYNTEAAEKSQIVQAQDVMKTVEVDELNMEISIPLDLHLEQSDTASWYNESEVSFIEINGHEALLEDGVRRTIHLASDKKFFTISGANVSVDLLVEIAEKIDI